MVKALANGNWKGWLVGIVGSLIVAAVTNGILFQIQVKEQLAHNDERLKRIEVQARDQVLREFKRQDERTDKLSAIIEGGSFDRRLDALQSQIETLRSDLKRLQEQEDRMLQALDAQYNALNDHLRSHGAGNAPQPRR